MSSSLNARSRKILYAAVTEFIATGEPVGSRTIAKKYGIELSPASIRNVLSDLEEDGYFHKLHASAGRAPTEKAFRMFIDALLQLRRVGDDVQQTIESRFNQLGPRANVLRETAQLLSVLTGTAAVISAPKLEGQTLKQLRFIPTRAHEVLAVIVTSSGHVENRFLQVDQTPSNEELVRIHNLLDDVLEGRTLRDVRDLFARRLQDARNELGELRRKAFELGSQALKQAGNEIEIVIEGQSSLFDKPEFSDVDRIKQLVKALEERERWMTLLDHTVNSKGVQVVMGAEGGAAPLGIEQLTLVSTRYALHGDEQSSAVGTVGVLGPTRMDYEAIVPIVNETAKAVGAYLSRRERSSFDSDEKDRSGR